VFHHASHHIIIINPTPPRRPPPRLSVHLQRLRDDTTDAIRLTPGDMLEENAYIQVRMTKTCSIS
jgi:hypothetical protein